ncbi:hypothetical protein ZORO111902_10960 [Zobellia roscoffensis]
MRGFLFPIEAWRNQPNHNIYNNLILEKLNIFNRRFPDVDEEKAFEFLEYLIEDIEKWILANPNKHLNELILP